MAIDGIGKSGHRPIQPQFDPENKKAAEAKKETNGIPAAQDKFERAQPIDLFNIGAVQTAQPVKAAGVQTQALTGGATGNALPDHETQMPYYDQGNTNGCGTTSLAMVMTYLGIPTTQGDVDHAIRRMNIFTAPDMLIDYARGAGLEAEGYNNGSWDELKGFIDRGIPVIALIDAGGNGNIAELHYMAVVGYETDPATGKEYVLIHDPARGGNSPATRMPKEEFLNKWKDLPGSHNNYFIAVAPKGTALPPGRDDGIEGVSAMVEGVAHLTNGLDRIGNPDSFGGFLHGIAETVGGVVETVVGGVGFGVQWVGDKLSEAVDGIPVVEQLVKPVGTLIETGGAIIGDLADGFGDAANHVGSAFEKLFDGDVGGFFSDAGSAVVDVAKGVGEAVWDGIKGVGEAIGDFFSGW